MMRVTGIEELSKTRSKVYLDGEFAFVLYKGELCRYHIREGEELSEESRGVILGEILPKRAKLRAMNLLKSREYTTAQLRDKLERGMYPAAVIEEAIAYVASFRYTDDLRYAVQYMICHGEERSRRRIERDLQTKGIDRETIGAAWIAWEEQGGASDESGMIRRLLEKRRYDPERADYGERQRQAAFLMRKGFAVESIRKVLRGFDEGPDAEF